MEPALRPIDVVGDPPSPCGHSPDPYAFCLDMCRHCGKEVPIGVIHQCPESLLHSWDSYSEDGFVYTPEDPPVVEPVAHTACHLSAKPNYGKFRQVVSDCFAARPYLVGFTDRNSWENMTYAEYKERVSDMVTGVPIVNKFFNNVEEGAHVRDNFIDETNTYSQHPYDSRPSNVNKPQSQLDYALVHWFRDSYFYFERFLADVDRSLSTSKLDLMAYCPIFCSNKRLAKAVSEKLDPVKFPVIDDYRNAVIYIADEDFNVNIAKAVRAVWAFSWIARSVSDCQGGVSIPQDNCTVDIHFLCPHRTTGDGKFIRRCINLPNMGPTTAAVHRCRYSHHPLKAWDGLDNAKKKKHTKIGIIPGGKYPTPWGSAVGVMRILKHDQEIEFYKPLTSVSLMPDWSAWHDIPFRAYRLTNNWVFNNWTDCRFFVRRHQDQPVHWVSMSSKRGTMLVVSTHNRSWIRVDPSGSSSASALHGFAVLRDNILVNPVTYGVAGRIGISPSPFSNEFTMRALSRFGGVRFEKSYVLESAPRIGEDLWGFPADHATALLIADGAYCSPFSVGYSEDHDANFFYPPLCSTPRFDQFATLVGLNAFKKTIHDLMNPVFSV